MNKKELFEKYSSYEYEYDILSHPDITYDEAKVILELRQDPEIKMIFNSIYGPNREIIKAIKKIANDKKVRNAFIKISNKLNKIDEFDGEELLPKLNDDYFVEYINIIDDDNITRNISIYSLLFKYSQDTEVDNFLENPKLFNIYVNDNQKRYYNLDDINKYKEVRHNHYVDMINNGHDRLLFNIASSYFGMNYTLFKENIQNIKYIDSKLNFIKDKELLNYIDSIDKLDKEGLIEYIEKVKDLENYFKDIKKTLRDISKNDIIKNIKFMKISKERIKHFDGEEFLFLVHKIKGLLKPEITRRLEKDISEWDKNYQEHSSVSCSIISDENLSLTGGNFITLGFQNITKDQILAISNKDMFFKSKDIKGKQLDLVSNYLLVEQILKTNNSYYNEVAIKRFDENKKAVQPDYVVTFNIPNDKSLNASQYFKVPIYNIKTEAYALKLVKKLKLLKEKDYKSYIEYITRLEYCLRCDFQCLSGYYDVICSNINCDSKEEENLIKKYEMMKNRK